MEYSSPIKNSPLNNILSDLLDNVKWVEYDYNLITRNTIIWYIEFGNYFLGICSATRSLTSAMI